MMSEDQLALASFVRRSLSDENVCFDEISDVRITPATQEGENALREFWNELMIFVNDFDIRMRDSIYNEKLKKRLRHRRDELVRHKVLYSTE